MLQQLDIQHRVFFQNAAKMAQTPDSSVDLVVTSPPYPMVEMWDPGFSAWDPDIAEALEREEGMAAFSRMHSCLDKVWYECARALKPGGFVCVNIGDATRKLGSSFFLYPNHSVISQTFLGLGFQPLPEILWRKSTNAPNKFMGSGMLPAGAYVTLEHEFILIFRKGGKRTFSETEKLRRRESAYFWEERNAWFSDLWELVGARQKLSAGTQDRALRSRSGAFPLEIAHRLINMYSLVGDTVLDPFMGTGTTLLASVLNRRNSVGYEIDPGLKEVIEEGLLVFEGQVNELIGQRIEEHLRFTADRKISGKTVKYTNSPHGFPVMTQQETGAQFHRLHSLMPLRGDEEARTAGTQAEPLEYQSIYLPIAQDFKIQQELF